MHYVMVLCLFFNGHLVVQTKAPPQATLEQCRALEEAALEAYVGGPFYVTTACIWQP